MKATDDFELIFCADEDEWKERRLEGLGGSDAPSVLGLSPYKSVLDIYLERTGGEVPDAEGEQIEAGHFLEDGNARWFAKRHGVVAVDPVRYFSDDGSRSGKPFPPLPHSVIVRSKRYPWMQCTPDRIMLSRDKPPGVLQLKNVDRWMLEAWEDSPPLAVQAQLQHEMACLGFSWGAIGAVVGGNRRKDAPYVERHDRFLDGLVKAEEQLWQCIQSKTLPELDGQAATTAALGRMYPKAEAGSTCEVPADLIQRLIEAKDREKECKAEAKALENALKGVMGEHEVATVEGVPVWSWKVGKRAVMEKVGEAETRVLRKMKGAAVVL